MRRAGYHVLSVVTPSVRRHVIDAVKQRLRTDVRHVNGGE